MALPSAVQPPDSSESSDKRRSLHALFELSILLKGLDGALELVGGVLLFFVNQDTVDGLIDWLAGHNLPLDRNDYLNDHLSAAAANFSTSTQHFASIYLVLHGLMKIGLCIGMQRRILWSYPVSVAFLVAFSGYQLWRWQHTHAVSLVVFSVLDLGIAAMVWNEYRRGARDVKLPPDER